MSAAKTALLPCFQRNLTFILLARSTIGLESAPVKVCVTELPLLEENIRKLFATGSTSANLPAPEAAS